MMIIRIALIGFQMLTKKAYICALIIQRYTFSTISNTLRSPVFHETKSALSWQQVRTKSNTS